MHGRAAALAEIPLLWTEIARAAHVVDALICPPAPYIAAALAAAKGTGVLMGAQDCSEVGADAARTGEVSAAMLADAGARYVIVGHSERRSLYGESDHLVATKYQVAQAAGLTPILCVGETLQERESNITEEVIARQLDAVINTAGVVSLSKAVIAYEPVWAIGTGKTASPEQAQAVHAFIRQRIAALDARIAEGLVIQYGGSVKAANAAELMAQPDIDGALVGGASLVANEFVAICQAAAR